MTNKKTVLKNILAGCSTLAITLAASDAMAAGALVQLGRNPDAALRAAGRSMNGALNQNALQLNVNDTVLNVQPATAANPFTQIRGIDTAGKTDATLKAGAQAFTLGVVVDSTRAAAALVANDKVNIEFTGTNELILDGQFTGGIQSNGGAAAENDYSALGDVDFKAHNANLKFDLQAGGPAVVDITSNIGSSDTDNTGKLQVSNGVINFKGDIGATNSLSSITIKNQQAAIFSGAIVKARDIVIGGANGGLITFGNGTAAGTDIVSENGISGAADATLTANANVIKIQDNATLNAEVLGHINAIEIGAASQLKVTDKAINAGAAITLADAAARVIFTSDNYVVNPTINGATADDQGIIEVAATDVTFTNSIGDANAINTLVVNDTKSAIFSGATVNAETITIGGANGGLITFGNGTVGQTTNIVSTNGISGAADATLAGNANVIKIQGNATLNADVVGANINLIEIQNGSKLIVNNKAIHAAARIKTAVGDEGELVLVNVNTHSNIAEVGAKLKTVTLDNLEAGAATALANEVHAVTLDLTNNTQLIINDKIKSDTVTNSNGVGKLVVQGADADVDFNIGTAAQYVDIDFATKHDLNIFNNRIVYGNLTGAAQGDLNLAGANSEFILKDNGTAGVIKGAGIFRTAGNATFGNIGFAGVGNSIALFEMQGAAGTLVTANTADIHAAAMTQGAQTLRLTQDLTIHGAYTANGSTVNLNTHDMTFNGHAEFTGSRIEIGEKTVTFANTSEFKGNNVITLDFHEANRTLGAVERTGAPMTIAAGVGIEIQINIVNGALPTALPAGTADSDIVFIDTGITRANATFADADAAVRITVGGNPLINTAGWAKTDDVGTLRFTPLPVAAPGAGAPLVPGAGAPTADAVNKALATFGIDIKALETKFAAFQQAADNMESGPEYDKLVAEAAEALKDAILNNNNVPADKKAVLQGAMIQGIVDENNKFPLQYNTVQFDAIVHTLYDATKTDVSTARIEHMLNNSNNFAQSALIAAADTAVTREDKQHKTVAATALAVAQHATAAVSSAVTNAIVKAVELS